jgi:hypothetical protein
MRKKMKPNPLKHRALKGIRGYQGLAQPYFNDTEELRFMRELRRAGRRKAAEQPERLSKAQRLKDEKVEFGAVALYRLQETAVIVQAKRKVADRRNPPVIYYTDGTTSLDRAAS